MSPFGPEQRARFQLGPLLSPVQAFLRTEAAGGIVLLAATVAALLAANSSLKDNYHHLWARGITIDLDVLVVQESLRSWLNDGLMALFFLVVGLEVKRELLHGELSSVRRASLPVVAAFGGMVVPAVLFAAVNRTGPGRDGWGIPMATDIAFAVGALALLGRKAPLSLRVFVLALAIADDLGAIIVIALFYSGSLFLPALAWMAGLVLAWLGARRLGIRSGPVYVVLGIAIWLAMLESGLHATLAGVLVAILVPSRPRYSAEDLDASLATVLRARSSGEAIAPEYQVGGDVLRALERLVRDTESPLERLERALHGWVSFVVLPLFAYANAGVALSGSALGDAWHSEVSWGIVLGLVVGKPLGIVLATGVALRLRLGELPEGIALVHVIGAGILAGVGFTVSLFVTELAFGGAPLGNEARVGVLCASLVAGVVGFVWLWIAPGEPDVPIDDHPAAVTH